MNAAQWFSQCEDVQAVKVLYRELVKQHHPDLGGCTSTMQEINDQYHNALKGLDGHQYKGSDGEDHTYRYDGERETEIGNKLFELLSLKMAGVEIYLVGLWVWIKGDTKPYKDALKGLACRWSNGHQSWYFRPESCRTWHSGKSFSQIASDYGAHRVVEDDIKRGSRNIGKKRELVAS